MAIYDQSIMVVALSVSVGVLSVCYLQEHFLTCLLALELSYLSLFFALMVMVSEMTMTSTSIFLMLVMMVSEGSYGLSLLISLSRAEGSDLFSSMLTMK